MLPMRRGLSMARPMEKDARYRKGCPQRAGWHGPCFIYGVKASGDWTAVEAEWGRPVRFRTADCPRTDRKGGGPSRNRTGVQGFAVLCVTTPPSGRERCLSKAFRRWSTPPVRCKRIYVTCQGVRLSLRLPSLSATVPGLSTSGGSPSLARGNTPDKTSLHRKCIRQI